ncbi:unnamed protein product [Rhizoctonia solani]|uniref:GST N-terminal domain-containing protein n=1 Tax=Rhizoctonia solani TaxID=456999 RepID=A0A8H3CWS7_9AGAM|nr:unnamed protein product [Rhizoctonia solani]
MAATKENPIVFYDLADANGTHWSFNTYKARLSLNFKGIPYRVEYISFPEIESRMAELGVHPISDTFPRYTLPVIADPSSGPDDTPTYVSDSFKIAIYLDEHYPSRPIFPTGTRATQNLLMNSHFLTITYTLLIPLVAPSLPTILDTRSVEYFAETRGMLLRPLPEEEQLVKWKATRDTFGGLAKAMQAGGGRWMGGDSPTFVDFIIDSFFYLVERLEGHESERLRDMCTWDDGLWGRFWDGVKLIERGSSEI